MPQIVKLISMEEASQHNTKDDCWVVIDGKVYDVSSYLDEHPGGDDVMIEATGRDATEDFDDAGHSKTAKELMETFCIGELDTSEPVVEEEPECSRNFLELTKQYWVVPAVIAGISVAFGFLYLRKKC